MPGVYIAYPFCAQKCTYCNFASGVGTAAVEAAYHEALCDEIRRHEWSWRPETVYLGGGSPDRLSVAALERLVALIPGKPWREATIEAAPGGIAPEAARAWVQAGITRVSLGVQSFVPGELARTGRKHTPETVGREVEILREAGFNAINIDLIAGLPGQSHGSWDESLNWIERLAVDHVSVYMLEVDEDSRLGQELLAGGRRYGADGVPDESAIIAFYETAVERLENMGIRRYEISNFARPGHESLHNLKYWRLEPYAGFGADAHSFDGATRWENVRTATEYIERGGRGEPVCAASAPARLDEERFFVGMRLADGIAPASDEWRRFEVPIARFLRDGLLEREGDRLRLTRRGVLLSNEVFQEFVSP